MAVFVGFLCVLLCTSAGVDAAGKSQKCTNPEGKDGESYTESCLKHTCISGVWKTSLDRSVCCSSGVAFSTNTTISSTNSEDGCVKVQVNCVEEGGHAKEVVHIENLYEDREVKLVVLTSRGEAGVQRGSRMGQYVRTGEMAYGAPVFAQVATGNQFYLFYGRDGLWRVGPNIGSYSGSELKSNKKNEATPPSGGWMYYDGNRNKWFKDWEMKATTYLREDCRREEGSPTRTELLKNEVPSFTNQGILISGGKSDEEEQDVDYVWDRDMANAITTSVEMFLPETGRICRIHDLGDDRMGHTMDWVNNKVVICGGLEEYTENSCIQFSEGSWWKYATMVKGRSGHTSWVSKSGLVLLSEGAEVVEAGSSAKNLGDIINTSGSCGINEVDSTIITGGSGSRGRAVERYNEKGFVEKLPDLKEGRNSHGCGSYESDGKKVLLVAGGEGLSSTEKLLTGPGVTASWITAKPLPRKLYFVASVSARNAVYIIGGSEEGGKKRSKDILMFDGESWKKVAEMKWSRSLHAASVVDTTHLMKFCN